MSTVHESDRSPLPEPLEFQVLAYELDDEATRVAGDVISKHHRFTIGTVLANAASSCAELCDLSQEHYPSSPLAAYDKKKCYSRAIAKAKLVKRQLNKARRLHVAETKKLQRGIELANELIGSLRKLKGSVQVQGDRSKKDAIEWLQAQIDAIEASE